MTDENERLVEKLVSIFDLKTCDFPSLSNGASPRIMLVYDRKENIRKFRVLNKNIPQEAHHRITSWLEMHFEIDENLC